MSLNPHFETIGEETPFDLFAGEFPRASVDVIIAAGGEEELPAGAVLGRITASGKYILSLSAAADGSEVPRAILARAADPSNNDVTAPVYRTGDFNERALTFGTGHDADSVREGLSDLNIYVRKTISR